MGLRLLLLPKLICMTGRKERWQAYKVENDLKGPTNSLSSLCNGRWGMRGRSSLPLLQRDCADRWWWVKVAAAINPEKEGAIHKTCRLYHIHYPSGSCSSWSPPWRPPRLNSNDPNLSAHVILHSRLLFSISLCRQDHEGWGMNMLQISSRKRHVFTLRLPRCFQLHVHGSDALFKHALAIKWLVNSTELNYHVTSYVANFRKRKQWSRMHFIRVQSQLDWLIVVPDTLVN